MTRYHLTGIACFIGVLGAMATHAASPVALTGNWGGDQANLTLTSAGGQIEYGCGNGTIGSPIRIAADGKFSVRGHHHESGAGGQRADVPAPMQSAKYWGHLEGDRLTLHVRIAGQASDRVYRLDRNRRAKVIHCL
jgi:hypothetical protein